MKAKILVYALPALVLTTIHLAQAQQGGVYHVGVPSLGESSSLQGWRERSVMTVPTAIDFNIAYPFGARKGVPHG
jgi:hypothetical protein